MSIRAAERVEKEWSNWPLMVPSAVEEKEPHPQITTFAGSLLNT